MAGTMGLLDRYRYGDRGIPDSPLAANPDTYEPRAEGGLLSAPVPKEMRGQYGNFFLTNRPENKPMLENPMNVHPDYTAQIKPSATETPAVPMSKENQRAGFIQFAVSKGKSPDEAKKYADVYFPGMTKKDYKSQIIQTGDGYQVADYNPETGSFDLKSLNDASGKPIKIGKPMSNEMITTEQQIGSAKDLFDRIKTLYKSDYVGAIEGRVGAVRSATVGNPTERAAFYSNLQDLNNSLVYLKSGKQINEQEYKRLKDAMPHRNLADSDFEARMKQFEITLGTIMSERAKKSGAYGGVAQPTQGDKTGYSHLWGD